MTDSFLDRSAKRTDPSVWTARSCEGMVSCAHYRASEVGARILKSGGNAVDAACAVSMALGVCEPAGSGLGGMAMMLVHLAREKRTTALVGACRAPRAATPETVRASARYNDYKAVAVPGQPAAVAYALKKYGTKSQEEILAGAISLAEEGFSVTSQQNKLTRDYLTQMADLNGSVFFLTPEKEPFAVGSTFRQPVLAKTLRRLAKAGLEDFYTGEIGAAIAADMKANDGFIREEDLRAVPWPEEIKPAAIDWENDRAFSIGPPAGGTTLLEILSIAAAAGLRGSDLDTPKGALLLAEIIRRCRTDRRRLRHGFPEDPDTGLPEILSERYARSYTSELKSREIGAGETTHISVMDRFGNAVALTQSIERVYGAKVATPSLGFLYNGFLKAFKVKDEKHPHYLRPGGLARSNASPTLVLRNGRPWAALGATGSERMASVISQVLLRLKDATPFEAVHAPRIHCTPEGFLQLERGRIADLVADALQQSGLTLQPLEDYSFRMGGVHLTIQEEGVFYGVAEPRRDGAAFGPDSI